MVQYLMSSRVCHFLTASYKNHPLRTKRGPIISSLFVTVFVFLAFLTSPAFSYYCVCDCWFSETRIAASWGSGTNCSAIPDYSLMALACTEPSTSAECDAYCAGASFSTDCGHGCDQDDQCLSERGRYYAEQVEGVEFVAGDWDCPEGACEQPPVSVVSVPTMTEWGMILFVTVMGLIGVLSLKRRIKRV